MIFTTKMGITQSLCELGTISRISSSNLYKFAPTPILQRKELKLGDK